MKTFLAFAYTIARPRFWGYLAGPYLIGYTCGISHQSALLNPFFIVQLFYFLTIANVLLYGVNDVFDRATDEKNPKKKTHEHRLELAEQDRLKKLLMLAMVVSIGILFIQPDITAMLLFTLFLFLAVFYSAPPLRFKAKPFLDFASNVLYVLPGFLGYYQVVNAFPPGTVFLAVFCWTGAMHLFSAIPDIVPDKKAGIQTTAVVLGEKNALFLCAALWFVFAITIAQMPALFPWSLLAFVYPMIPLYVAFYSKNVQSIYWKFPYITMVLGMILFFITFLQKPASI